MGDELPQSVLDVAAELVHDAANLSMSVQELIHLASSREAGPVDLQPYLGELAAAADDVHAKASQVRKTLRASAASGEKPADAPAPMPRYRSSY